MDSLYAELLLLTKRSATWILLGVAVLMTVVFSYVLPYSTYLTTSVDQRRPTDLSPMLPEQLVASLLGGFPFYLGMLTLILGTLVFGSEYGWDTVKTTLMQRADRARWLLTKLAALGVIVALFTVTVFAVAAITSSVIAIIEGAAMDWPSISTIGRGLGAGWLILALWAMFGSLLAILSRGTAMAIGLGILYGLVIEGLISALGADIGIIQNITQGFLRANAYSLVQPLGAVVEAGGEPGAYAGPFVNTWQALLVIVGYLAIFTSISALVLRRRDIS